jgi:two-component system heavy metal sensor histidine kinase CusS
MNNLRAVIEVALGKPRTGEEYRDTLGSCLEECGRLTRLIDSLLFLARAENPKTVLNVESVDMAEELCVVSEYFGTVASEAGVYLSVDAPSGMQVEVDRTLFQRAVSNLVMNGIAHTPDGGSVTLEAMQDSSDIVMKVRDTGDGIAAEDLPHIFERFYRADKARSAASGRVGLGLAIVKGIVECHGGSVAAASNPGAGTSITMRFPLAPR